MLEVTARDAQGNILKAPQGLVWVSDNPTAFDIDQQGRVTAKVSQGQVRLSVRHIATGIRAEVTLIMRGSSTSGSSGGISPVAPALRNCATGQGCISLAGTGTSGFLGDFGPATEADFDAPHGLAFANGRLYIADAFNHRVRYIENGTVFPLAGSGVKGFSENNPLAVAQAMNFPQSIWVHENWVYLSDKVNNRVRVVNTQNGEMQTLAGGGTSGDGVPATQALLNYPTGIVRHNNSLYLADTLHHRIRRIDLDANLITTLAGGIGFGYTGDEGPARTALLHTPQGLWVHNQSLLIADTMNHCIRKVDLATGIISTLAGTGSAGDEGDGGKATLAQLNQPTEMVVDSQQNLYFVDSQNAAVRRLNLSTGHIHTLAKGFERPYGIALDTLNNTLYVSDTLAHRIYEIRL